MTPRRTVDSRSALVARGVSRSARVALGGAASARGAFGGAAFARGAFGGAAFALVALAGAAFAQDDADALAAIERRTAETARDAAPSIVGVTAVTEPVSGPRLILPGLALAAYRRESEKLEATGFFVDAEGIVATTFEIARDAARFEVRFADGTSRDARLLGTDEPFRVAILRTSAPSSARAVAAAGESVDEGRRALGWLVSAVRRGAPDVQLVTVRNATCSNTSYDHWLTASVTLREGAGGGPMLSREGRLLGMAVGSVVETSALPTTAPARSTLFVRGADVLDAARAIVAEGRVRRPRLGVLLESSGNRVDELVPGGPAEVAGVREGDQVIAVAGEPVANAAQIARALLRRRAGESVAVEALRSGATVALNVVLGEATLPPLPTAAPIEGAILEMPLPRTGEAAAAPRGVTVTALETDCAFAHAGLQVGDEVLNVDGANVFRFLTRHRVRPATGSPAELVVRRDGADIRIARPKR